MEVGWSFPNSGGGGSVELNTTNPFLYALYESTDITNINGEATYEDVI